MLLMHARRWLVALWLCGCGAGGERVTAPDAAAGSVEDPEALVQPTRAATPLMPAFARTHGDALLLANQPASVVPAAELVRYRIDQRIDDEDGTLSGSVEIRFENRTDRPLRELPLLMHPNAAAELGAGDAGRIDTTAVERLRDGKAPEKLAHRRARPTLLLVQLGAPLAPKQALTLRVRYQGKLRRLPPEANDMLAQAIGSLGTMLGGSGSADYGLLAVGDGILTAASAYPMVAPYRDGSFDTGKPAKLGDHAYNEVADFEVTTRVPRGVLLVSNLVDDTAKDAGDGWTKVVSRGSHVRDFVLVAGRDLERSQIDVDDTRVTSVYRAPDAEAGRRALAMAASSLRSFERRFGDYPYRELDVVQSSIVGGAGGVEFSAMVLIAGMLYRDPLKNGPLGGMLGNLSMTDDLLDFTVAHEVAHQYFAGIVGNDSRRFPSLDEPIAQYAAGLAIEDRQGKPAAERAMNSHVKMNYAVYRMMGGRDNAVLRDVSSFRTPIEYAALVYGKAPYVYVELRKKLGDDRLHRAIRRAVDDHRFGLVTTEQWIAALEKHTGRGAEVRASFTRWLRQTHADADLGIDGSGDFLLDAMLPGAGAPKGDVRALLKKLLRDTR